MNYKWCIPGGVIFLVLLCSIGIVSALEDNSPDMQIAGIIPDDMTPYPGPLNAGSPLFGLQIAMEDLDETFTFNDTQRVEKQIDHAQLRLAVVKRELGFNRTNASERAIELYWQKLDLTERSLTLFTSNSTGLLHAQEMIVRHQEILADLSLRYPNNTGLARAYNNSLLLEQKFEQKTELRLSRFIERNNKTVFKAVRLEKKERDHTSDENTTVSKTMDQAREKIQEKGKNQKNEIPLNLTTTQTSRRDEELTATITPKDIKDPSKDQGKKGRD